MPIATGHEREELEASLEVKYLVFSCLPGSLSAACCFSHASFHVVKFTGLKSSLKFMDSF